MATEIMLVRLKPFNKKKGHVLRRYTYRGIRFQGARGWYRVTRDVADYLVRVFQVPGDEDSPQAFDVCTESEAKRIDKLEAHHARGTMPAEEATDATNPVDGALGTARAERSGPPAPDEGGDLKTADLPQNRRKRGKK